MEKFGEEWGRREKSGLERGGFKSGVRYVIGGRERRDVKGENRKGLAVLKSGNKDGFEIERDDEGREGEGRGLKVGMRRGRKCVRYRFGRFRRKHVYE